MAQPATASPTQPPHYTSITGQETPMSELPAPPYTSKSLHVSFKMTKNKRNPTTVAVCVSRLTGLWAGLCCSVRVLGAPGSVPPCQVEGLQAKAQIVGVREATGRLLRGRGEKHAACHCFFRVLEVCSD